MNGLVGYGSSSEEEDAPSPSAVVSTDAPTTQVKNDVSHKSNGTTQDEQSQVVPKYEQIALEPTQGPMVGPAMPTTFAATEYEEDLYDEPPPMSERDMLRYLTQPSRPMASLPPEPSDSADSVVTTKIKRFLELKSQGVHFNEDLANKTSFKNPSLFASLLERAGVSSQAQYSSTLPSDIFSLDLLPEWAYKEGLLKSQQKISTDVEILKKSQSASGKRTIEFTSAGRSGGTSSRESTPGSLLKRKRN